MRLFALVWGGVATAWGFAAMLWGAYALSNDFLLAGAMSLICGLSVLVLCPRKDDMRRRKP